MKAWAKGVLRYVVEVIDGVSMAVNALIGGNPAETLSNAPSEPTHASGTSSAESLTCY